MWRNGIPFNHELNATQPDDMAVLASQVGGLRSGDASFCALRIICSCRADGRLASGPAFAR